METPGSVFLLDIFYVIKQRQGLGSVMYTTRLKGLLNSVKSCRNSISRGK